MTDSDTQVETWKPIPGYPDYQASDHGRVRSIPREQHGRAYAGVIKSTRVSNSGYVLVDVIDTTGRKQTRTVHALVLEAFTGPRPRGQEARHLNDDPLDNRLTNLVWGTKAENVEDTFRNGRQRAAPKPPKVCVRCSGEFDGPGRRCHPCVTEIGETAARLLAAGVPLDRVAERLDYPSQSGVLLLAQRYGALRLVLAAPSPRATVTQRGWRRFLRGDSR